jgi:hypothetical protein
MKFTPVRCALVFAALLLSACASTPAIKCRPTQKSMVDDSLYFGLTKPGGAVTDEEWARFLAVTVTPRFPQGLTVFEATGQWRGANGKISREPTRVLRVIHPDDENDEKLVSEIIKTYETQFEQESVLRVRVDACASF